MTRSLKRRKTMVFWSAAVTVAVVSSLLSWPMASAANPAFVQGRSKQVTNGTGNSLAFSNANAAGNLIVAYVVWDNSSPVTLRDSRGNTYATVAPAKAWGVNGTWRSQVFYAKDIAGGPNTVTATFQAAVLSFGRLYIHEYSGLDRTAPLDASSASTGTASAMNSGSATTSSANDLIFGAGSSNNGVTAAGAGFTTRLNAQRTRTEDKTATTAGPNSATATQNGSQWVMQMAAFKPDTADRTPPTTPTGLTAAPASGSKIDLTWTGSTDDVGVVGYKVFRSGTQVGTTTATSYSDTGLNDATTYSYTVRAYDAADNTSAASNTASATTMDVTPPSVPANLAAQVVSSTQVNLSWNASSDNVGVTGYKVFRDDTLVTTATGTSYQDTGRSAGTTYSYTVLARDGAGNESAKSSLASATTPASDTTPPGASITAPAAGSVVSGSVTVSAAATDNVAVAGVQFLLDGAALGSEDTTTPYSTTWNTATASNGVHTLQARARDTAGNVGISSSSVTVTVSNTAPPPTPGLVAGWSFNENFGRAVNDVSGKANTATFAGDPTWAVGKYGGGLRFDGVNDYLTAPNSPTLNLSGSAMTLSMWVNPLGGGGVDQVVFAKFWSSVMQSPVYQYALELTGGASPTFFIGTAGGLRAASMGAPLPLGQWSHLAIVFNGSQAQFYLNGNPVSSPSLSASITPRDSVLYMAADERPSQFFSGTLDDVRLYDRAETGLEVKADMDRPLTAGPSDATAPSVSITSPSEGAVLSGARTILADASDDVGVAGVQFYVDGDPQGPEDTVAPYAANWDTRAIPNGAHVLAARARDTDNKTTVSTLVSVTVANSDGFQNDVLATGFDLPTTIKFLPDGRLLLAELAGKILVLPPPYTTPAPSPFLQITNIPNQGVQQGIFDLTLDPNFSANHYFYVFYTTSDPGADRLSRFTANSTLTGTVPGSELVLYQDPEGANVEHHGGAITFGNDGMIYFTTGDHFQGTPSQDLNSPRGKLHRIRPDGVVPTDNPFYDGPGPHWDSVWAYGLRNPFRAYFDLPSGRLFIGDVGGNGSQSWEEVNLGARGANYGWPDVEGPCSGQCTNPLYTYIHDGNGSSITGGFVYHGTQFPTGMQGDYFFADYSGHWIKRMAFDANGNINGVFNFEPLTGNNSAGDIVYLTEGPDGALYYLDLGYADNTGTFGISKLRRIRYLSSNQAPVALASANTTSGPAPLIVNFSSAGSNDPEGQPITYSWDFGDGSLSTAANPSHTFAFSGQYVVRLTVSDGENSSISTPLTISVGTPPTATIASPTDGATFRAGDVISYSGNATDPEDGNLPASAYTWNIDFLHDTHVHPGTAITGIKAGTFVIPTSGHDFSGSTRYRITLTVTDSNGLKDTKSVVIWPQKVNLSFDTSPSGLTVYVDGIARTTPFVLDTLVGFNQTIEARDQTSGGNSYSFDSWSDGGAQSHTIVVPTTAQSYTARYKLANAPPGVVAAWGFNEGSGASTADASGNNNTATLVGGPTWVAGKYGKAVSFDQVNDYLSVPNSFSLNIAGSAMTLSMWINTGSISSDSVVLAKFWNTNMSSPYYQYGLELSGGKPKFYIGTSAGLVGAGMDTALALNQWTHLAVVFNGSTAQFYLNGTLVATKSLVASITARGMPLRIGADADPWQFYKGSLDNVRIYNRALSALEVTVDMNSGI
jgi:glucose/arabinose dehydrogenase/PKD repeat protein/fibronectin type 3 domain-containing protein